MAAIYAPFSWSTQCDNDLSMAAQSTDHHTTRLTWLGHPHLQNTKDMLLQDTSMSHRC